MGSSESGANAAHLPRKGPSREQTFEVKITVVGGERVGKTSLIRRLAGEQYISEYRKTVSFDFRVLNLPGAPGYPNFRVQLWDTAGDPNYRSLLKMLCRGAHALVFVYDTCSWQSFLNLQGQPREVGKLVGAEHVLMIAGTKIDLSRAVAQDEAVAFAAACGALYVEVSARTDRGVSELLSVLMEEFSRRGWIPPGWARPGAAVEQRSLAAPPRPSRPRPPEAVRLAAPARPLTPDAAGSCDRFASTAADDLRCVICFEAAVDAFELSCCHKLVCGECEGLVRKREGCPHCRATEWRLEAAARARRLVASLPARCGWCGEGVLLGGLRAHEDGCAAARVRCSVVGCDFEGLRSEFAAHAAAHG